MRKPGTGEAYDRLRFRLLEERKKAGLLQSELATLIGRPHIFISRYETGERRLDVIEFLEILNALKLNSHLILDEINQLLTIDRKDQENVGE
jgi:transcriptional regulator with XRE-family HTH domain